MQNRPQRWLGALFILAGLLLNKWSIEHIFLASEHLASSRFIALIVIFEIGCIALGLWFLLRRLALSIPVVARRIGVFGLVVGVLVGGYGNLKALRIIDPHREMREVLRRVKCLRS